eukprot:GEMP01075864.1.p1 GENE.GEMP01075864.1~~GEMP01075864.1.p1  ORF type:complete len:211 (+),score=36.00 GEMP01075864.1:192-824(+)
MIRPDDESTDMTTHVERHINQEQLLLSTTEADKQSAVARSDMMKAVFAMNPKIRDALNEIHPKTHTDMDGNVRRLRSDTVSSVPAIPMAPVTEWMPLGNAQVPAVIRIFGMSFDGIYHRDFMDHDGRPTYKCRQIRLPSGDFGEPTSSIMLYYNRPTALWLLGKHATSKRAFARCKDPRVSPDGLTNWERYEQGDGWVYDGEIRVIKGGI